jgi:ribosomal protein L37AE/L43A
MPYIKLSDGTVAHVRMGKRGGKPSARDIEALEAAAKAIRELPRCPGCKRPNTLVEGACEICGWEDEFAAYEEDGPQDLEDQLERALDRAFPPKPTP